MTGKARYAFITPYYKEERSLLERCIASVRNQTIPADHFFVADGFPQDWLDNAGVRHFKLDRNHADYGNTPRGVGALIAIGEEYDGIGLLDADNWLEHYHLDACLEAAQTTPTPCDYVIARRTFRRFDGSIMPVPEDPGHVDTSCYFFLRGSFAVIPYWATQPRIMGILCDRYFYQVLRRQSFTAAQVSRPTVNYRCQWAGPYLSIGEKPPPEAKSIDLTELENWIRSLSPRELEIASRLVGIPLAVEPRTLEAARSIPCICGSGKRFELCHGAPSYIRSTT
jgi:hypothetical protein